MGIVITMASQGMISLPAGVALMLGAEVGTCSDTLIATIGRSRAAVRAGLFHLLFNVTTVAIGAAFASQLARFAVWISAGAGVARQIANAHVMFNVAGVLLMIGFVPAIGHLMTRIIPEGGGRRSRWQKLGDVRRRLLSTP
jgi:phosphate:Na+ symporter